MISPINAEFLRGVLDLGNIVTPFAKSHIQFLLLSQVLISSMYQVAVSVSGIWYYLLFLADGSNPSPSTNISNNVHSPCSPGPPLHQGPGLLLPQILAAYYQVFTLETGE